MPTPLKVAFPLGIGDCHWACQKMAGLSEAHDGAPIHAYVNESPHHVSVNYLKLVPSIAEAHPSAEAPYDIWHEMREGHRHPLWASREGCRYWKSFDYIAVANGHLELGRRIEDFWPDVRTEYTYELAIPDEDRAYVRRNFGSRRVLLYLSGTDPNMGFHRHWWTTQHWVEIMALLNAVGIRPVLVGARTQNDLDYGGRVMALADQQRVGYDSAIGMTNIPQYCAQIEDASVWMGLNSGGGIVSAMRGTPTVMFWSDDRYPAVADPHNCTVPLHHNMQTSWLAPEQLATYRTLSYGSPELTPERAVQLALEVSR